MNIIRTLTITIGILFAHCTAYTQCQAGFEANADGLLVSFIDTSMVDIDDEIISYNWDFGDGTTSETISPLHLYAQAGAYEVTLAIESAMGCEDTTMFSLYLCEIDMIFEVENDCGDDNQVTATITIFDEFENAGAIHIVINGSLSDDSPINLTEGTTTLTYDFRADGINRILTATSVEHPECSTQITIPIDDCVDPCFISHLRADLINTNRFTVDASFDGYNPNTLNILTGDYVDFVSFSDSVSVTSIADNNLQSWDSGLLGVGDTFSLYSYDPGIFNYESTHEGSAISGTLVSSCPNSTMFDLRLSFFNDGQEGSYSLYIDSVPSVFIEQPYVMGEQIIDLIVPGDGDIHTYEIRDDQSPDCFLSIDHQSPICGADPICNIGLEAYQSSICDEDSMVMVTLEVLSAGVGNTFDIAVNDIEVLSNIPYSGTLTTVDLLIPGLGNALNIRVTDDGDNTCQSSAIVLVEDCTQPCEITNFFAGIGSNNVFVANVNTNFYTPADITISAGDRVVWQWNTAEFRSVTAFDGSFDSGLQSEGDSYLSPILPVGVYPYYSVNNGMMGSVTVEPNCVDGMVPAIYTFEKNGGSNSGYNVLLDGQQVNNSAISYNPSGMNSGNTSLIADGILHSITVIDVLDTLCTASQAFITPTCDATTCGLLSGELIVGTCTELNYIPLSFELFSYNTDTTGYKVNIDGDLTDSGPYDITGSTMIDLLIPGDGSTHEIIIQDQGNDSCADTIFYDSPICAAPCSFNDLNISYALEDTQDSCFDGNLNLLLSATAVHSFEGLYVATLMNSAGIQSDTLAYPIDNDIHLSYELIANGELVDFSLFSLSDTTCRLDSSIQLFACEPDPCLIDVIAIEFGPCMDGGLIEMEIQLDTFRVLDSFMITLEDQLLYEGSYEVYLQSDTSFVVNFVEGIITLNVSDLEVEGCSYDYDIFLPFCSTDCQVQTSYSLIDSCIATTDEHYDILLSANVLNAISDSLDVEFINTQEITRYSTSDMEAGIIYTLPIAIDEPGLLITDSEDPDCRTSLVVMPPGCISECQIVINSVTYAAIDVNSIVITDAGLEPAEIFLEQGDTLLFINQSSQSEIIRTEVQDAPGAFLSPFISVGDTFMIVVETEGSFPIYSIISGGPGGIGTSGLLQVDYQCTDGHIPATIHLDYEFTAADSVDIFVDGIFTSRVPYSGTSELEILIPGDSMSHVIDIVDITDSSCIGSVATITPLCTYSCSDFEADFSFTIDTLSRTVSFVAGGSDSTTEWNWDFGDGSASVVRDPVYQYGDIGTYEVCLETRDQITNCTDNICRNLTIIDIDCQSTFELMTESLEIGYMSEATAAADIITYLWTINGDVISTQSSGTISVDTSGSYEVCHIITTDTECSDTSCVTVDLIELCTIEPSFSVEIANDTIYLVNTSSGNFSSTSWDLGNGTLASGTSVSYVYDQDDDYQVCMTVSNEALANCSFEICEDVTIEACRVNAAFDFSVIMDTLQASVLDLNHITDIDWDFGNGFNSSNNPVEYIYTEEGMYTVCLTVTDETIADCMDIQCADIQIILTDVDWLNSQRIKFYPNPVSRGMDIQINGEDLQIKRVQVLDHRGRSVIDWDTEDDKRLRIPTESLSPGQYTAVLHSSTGHYSISFIVVE